MAVNRTPGCGRRDEDQRRGRLPRGGGQSAGRAPHGAAAGRCAWRWTSKRTCRTAPPARPGQPAQGLLDALTHAGLWLDDSQVADLRIRRAPTIGGMVKVRGDAVLTPKQQRFVEEYLGT